MKLICDQCGAKYSIADEKVRGKVFKIRCKKCQNVIVVRGTDQPTAEGGQAITQNDSAPAADQPAADAEPIWYVVIGREQVGPLTDGDLEGRLGTGEVTGDSFVWQEGFSDWVQLRTVDRFAALTAGGAPAPQAPIAGADAPTAASPTNGAAAYEEQRTDSEIDDEATQAVSAGSIPGFAEHQAEMAAAAAGEADAREEATAIVNTAAVGAELAAATGAEPGGGHEAALAGLAAGAFGGDSGMTMEEGPAAAPFDAGGALAAGMAGSIAAGGGNDLMASTPLPGAASGADGMFSAFDEPAPADAGADPSMVGARNENSVLFSLKNLQSLAMGQGADAGPAPPSTDGQTDASGLIDVRALAGDVGRSGSASAVGDMGDDAVALAPAAPVMIPMVRRRSNTPIIIASVLGGCLILGLTAVVITLLLKGGDDKKPSKSAKATAVATSVATGDKKAGEAGGAVAAATPKPSEAAAKDDAKAKSPEKKAPKKEEDKPAAVERDEKDAVAAAAVRKKKSADRPAERKAPAKQKQAKARETDGGDQDLGDLLGGLGGSKAKKKAPAKKKAAPKPAAGKPKLGKKDIQKVVRSNGKRISRCATRIPGPPGQKVKIEMRWEIQPNGRVSGASVLTPKYKSHSVGRCVLSAVKAMRFPSHGGAPIKIGKYPFGLKK